MTSTVELTDVLVVGSGFGGAIPAYHLAAGGARVVVLERGPQFSKVDFAHDLRAGTYSRYLDLVVGDGVNVWAGNCVGGSSVVYFAASIRAPSFAFERKGSTGRRLWPSVLSRSTLDPWYNRVSEAIPVSKQGWGDVCFAGGIFAAACTNAGRTCNPVPVAVDLAKCVNCDWMLTGCHFDAKRSLLLNYIPAAVAAGAQVRPQHEVDTLSPATTSGYRYRADYTILDSAQQPAGTGAIEAKVVVLAAGALATPVVLQRSATALGGIPAAVGRYFSAGGDRLSSAVVNESKVRSVLGLSRSPTVAYEAFPIGKSINTMSFDGLRASAPEFTRFTHQQTYFAPVGLVLAQDPAASAPPTWFGVGKKEMRRRWRSWVVILTMGEDDNEGVFGPPPARGAYTRIGPALATTAVSYHPSANTLRNRQLADNELKAIFEKDGLAKVRPWTDDFIGSPSVHPMSSCRLGDDPATSALSSTHELRGHPGLFVTDASAVPGALCANPSLTIGALAERAVPGIVASARQLGTAVQYGAPAPDGSTTGRDEVMEIPSVRMLTRM